MLKKGVQNNFCDGLPTQLSELWAAHWRMNDFSHELSISLFNGHWTHTDITTSSEIFTTKMHAINKKTKKSSKTCNWNIGIELFYKRCCETFLMYY
jgi:hypothetical protein